MRPLDEKDRELVDLAREVAKRFSSVRWNGEKLSGVGCALRTKDGDIFSGPNIDHPESAPCSMCAEYTALGKAYSEGHTEVETIVACWHKNGDDGVIPPCGRCKEFMRLFGNPWVIIETDEGPRKARLDEIHPYAPE